MMRSPHTGHQKLRFWTLLLGLVAIAAMPALSQEQSTRRVYCMGQSWKLPVVSTKEKGVVLIKADHHVLAQVARALGRTLTWSVPDIALYGDNEKSLVLDQKELEVHGELVELPVPPQIIANSVHIPSDGLEGLLDCRVTVKPGKTGAIYVEPVLRDISFVDGVDENSSELRIATTVPVRKKVFKLSNPKRTVVDLVGVALPDGVESVHHPVLGELRLGQFKLAPSVARVVIPASGGVKVKNERSLDLFEHKLAVSWPASKSPTAKSSRPKVIAIKPVPPNSRQPVIKIKPAGEPDDSNVAVENPDIRKTVPVTKAPGRPTLDQVSWEGNRLKLEFSEPVAYQWSRVNAGKKRFVVDFHGVIFPKKKTSLNSGVPGLQAVRVVQNMPEPQPVVRLVCDLDTPLAVEPRGAEEKILYLNFPGRRVSSSEYPKGMGHTSRAVAAGSAKGRTICIDAGHGGSDPGALNRRIGINEKTVTLDISLKLANLLRKQGWNVIMTRTSDRDVSWAGSSGKQELGARARKANDYGADLFVSIHANASVNPQINGTSIHWYKSADYRLARMMEGGVMSSTGRKNRGLVKNRFYVLAHTQMPAVLIETAFLTNASEGKLLADPNYRSRIAQGIASGLQVYAARTFQQGAAKK